MRERGTETEKQEQIQKIERQEGNFRDRYTAIKTYRGRETCIEPQKTCRDTEIQSDRATDRHMYREKEKRRIRYGTAHPANRSQKPELWPKYTGRAPKRPALTLTIALTPIHPTRV